MKKIAIVGGGPSGCFLAYNLAIKGIKPIIFDDSHPRNKPCGGGLSARALKKFDFLKELENLGDKANNLKLISPTNRISLIESEHHCWAVSRDLFDKYLLEKAIAHGAHLITERVVQVKPDNGGWTIRTKNQTYNTDILVGADGVNSIVRKEVVGPINKKNLGLIVGYYAERNIHTPDGFKYLKGKPGYAYMFKRKTDISIGVGTYVTHSKEIKKELHKFIEEHYPDLKIKSPMWAHLCPFIKDSKFYDLPTAGKNWIIIGDAAGHVDPITYEGILYGLWGAELAAEALSKGSCEEYDRLWRKEYLDELKGRCLNVDVNYHPWMQEIQIAIAGRSKTFGKILYDTTNGIISINRTNKEILKHSPRILCEFIGLRK